MAPLAVVIVNTSPARGGHTAGRAPQPGCCCRSSVAAERDPAISSKIRPGLAAISRLALQTRGTSGAVVTRPSKHPAQTSPPGQWGKRRQSRTQGPAGRTLQPALAAPVDHQVLTRRPHRRAAPPVMLPAPQRLLPCDQAAEVARRPGIPRRPRCRQQPLGRDPALRLLHPPGDQRGHAVVVRTPRHPQRSGTTRLMPGRSPA